MRAAADPLAEQDLHQRSGALRARRIGASRLRLVEVPQDQRDAVAQTYRVANLVESVEVDKPTRSAWLPNDPQLPNQWALGVIGAPAAWEATNHGSTSARVAVLDSGISSNHPDLAGRIAATADFTGSGTGDRFGHGTAVAGVIAADLNDGIGIAGISNAALLDGKVLDDHGAGTESALLDGIVWAADQGARVINLSVGTNTSCSIAMQTTIDYAYDHGAVLVAAAGNSGARGLAAPASCQHVLAVAATDAQDTRASFSNYGPGVALAAPGAGIVTTALGGGYSSQDGTSFAAAHVSGAAALVWSTRWGTSNHAVTDRLLSTADHITGTGSYWQAGRLNLAAAVGASVSTPTPTPAIVATGTPTLVATGTPTVPATATPTPTASQTVSPTPQPSGTPTVTPTVPPTATATQPPLDVTATPTVEVFPLGCSSKSITLSTSSATMSPNVNPSTGTNATTSSPTPLQATLTLTGGGCSSWTLQAQLPAAPALPAGMVLASCNGSSNVALTTSFQTICSASTGSTTVPLTYTIVNNWTFSTTGASTTLSSITWQIL